MRSAPRLSAYALISDPNGRVLLTRPPGRHGSGGRWVLPGGGVEFGEHPADALVREVGEEARLRIEIAALREVRSDVTRVGRRHRKLHNVRLVYTADVVAGPPGTPSTGDEAGWFAAAAWRALPLEPFTAAVLAGLR